MSMHEVIMCIYEKREIEKVFVEYSTICVICWKIRFKLTPSVHKI